MEEEESASHPAVEAVHRLASKVLRWKSLQEDDRATLLSLIEALPREPDLADWNVTESWCIEVVYPLIDNPASLTVAVEPQGLEAYVSEGFDYGMGRDFVYTEVLSLKVDQLDHEDEDRLGDALAHLYEPSEDLLARVGWIDPEEEGYTFHVSGPS